MDDKLKEKIEALIAPLPIFEYAFMKSENVVFSDRVRYICESECPMHNTSYSCPPAVGTFEECRTKCLSYTDVFVFTTAVEVKDITDLSQTLPERRNHQEIVRKAEDIFKAEFGEVYTLSADACSICDNCSWPNEPCKHPDIMMPCIESNCIVVVEMFEECNMTFLAPGNTVIWTATIFFNS